jgi:hypothetical protein
MHPSVLTRLDLNDTVVRQIDGIAQGGHLRKSTAFLLVCVMTLIGVRASATQGCWADLDRDGVAEYVSITCREVVNGHPMGGDILVSRKIDGRLRVLWRQPRLNPWKLRIGDVDGDGHKEIVVGVYKKSRYDPVFAKRAFVYSWNGHRLLPKWLGSRLSRRFTDFVLCPLDRDSMTELVALEEAGKGSSYVTVYRWNTFGFDWLGHAGLIRNAVSISTEDHRVFVRTARSVYSLVRARGKYILTSEAGIEKQTSN